MFSWVSLCHFNDVAERQFEHLINAVAFGCFVRQFLVTKKSLKKLQWVTKTLKKTPKFTPDRGIPRAEFTTKLLLSTCKTCKDACCWFPAIYMWDARDIMRHKSGATLLWFCRGIKLENMLHFVVAMTTPKFTCNSNARKRLCTPCLLLV